MYVKNYMTKDVITISPETSLVEASDIMKRNKIHRLPVVNQGKLLGLVTRSLIKEHSPSGATSLSKYEMNYILDKTQVQDIMNKKVEKVSAEHLLEQAAVLMREANVGVLIVTEGDVIQGIITDKDIFRALADISGYNQPGASLVVEVEQDKRGVIEEIGDALLASDSNLTHLVVHHTSDGIRVVIHIDEDDPSSLITELEGRSLVVRSSEVKPIN